LVGAVAGALGHEDELLAVVGKVRLGVGAVPRELADVPEFRGGLRGGGTAREEQGQDKLFHGAILRKGGGGVQGSGLFRFRRTRPLPIGDAMREVSVPSLREEVVRLRGAVTLVRIHHYSGVKLHGPGSPLTTSELQAMQQSGFQSVFFADQGEGEAEAQRVLTTQVVDVRDLAMGDVLADTILGPDGEDLLGPGTFVDAPILEGPVRQASGPVTIKKRGMKGGPEQAAGYQHLLPTYAPHPPRPESGTMFAVAAEARPVRPILAPRSTVLVTLQDNFQRALVMNMIAVEGHEVVDRRWSDVSQAEFQRLRFDAILLDLADAPSALQLLRKSDAFKSVAVLVTAPEGRRSEVFKAISAGANGSVPMPVRREVL